MPVVMCYGDSNTHGRDAKTKGRLERNVRWPGVLQRLLGEEYNVIEEGLNGRTTVWDDPVRGMFKRNGSLYLLPCLESHSPLDLVILMLGTNDCKARFGVTAYDIGESLGYLIEIIQKSGCGRNGSPMILVLSPPPLGKLTEYAETFSGGVEKSRELARYYSAVAERVGCDFFDTSKVISSSSIDGLHIDPPDHERLANALAERVRDMIHSSNM
jgi:lysophospholipase L1-like esterase